MLPFGRLDTGEWRGLEVILERIPEQGQAGLSPSEAAAELLVLQLESRGELKECGSAQLGRGVVAGSGTS